LCGYLPDAFQRSASSKSSNAVWTPSSSTINAWKAPLTVRQKPHSRRNSTLSVVSNTSSSRSRSPEMQKPVQKQLRVVKPLASAARKMPQQLTRRERLAQKKVEIHAKGDTFGQLAKGVWYKAPKDQTADALLAEQKQIRQQRQASRQAGTLRRKAKKATKNAHFQTRYSKPKVPENTAKELKKLRKKVKDCNKIAEAQKRGQKLEVNQLAKLKKLKTYQKQLRQLEQGVHTGKAFDRDGFQTVF